MKLFALSSSSDQESPMKLGLSLLSCYSERMRSRLLFKTVLFHCLSTFSEELLTLLY